MRVQRAARDRMDALRNVVVNQRQQFVQRRGIDFPERIDHFPLALHAVRDQAPHFIMRPVDDVPMAGRTPLSETRAEAPVSMKRVVIGEKTAREINWIR